MAGSTRALIATDDTTLAFSSKTLTRIFAPGSTIASDAGVTSAVVTTYSVITTTDVEINSLNGLSTTFATTTVVTDPAVYSSLVSAAAASAATKTKTSASSHASSTSSSASSKAKSSSNLGTIIPAVVVPIAVILIATFAAFWFFMRRRHRRDLKNQPAFVMAGKTEKLTSTTNSLSSDHADHKPPVPARATGTTSYMTEKHLPSTQTRDVSSRPSNSSSSSRSDYPLINVGIAKTSNFRDEQRPSPLLPPVRTDSSSPNARHIANFSTKASPTTVQASRSANPHLNSQTPHNSVIPSAKNTSGRGPPAGVGTSSHVLARNRSQSLTNPRGANGNRSNPNLNSYRNGPELAQRPPTAPTSGFRGPPPPRSFSPAGQQARSFSPMGNRAAAPPPIKPPSPSSTGFINEPQYSPIIRDAPKAKRPSVVVPQDRGVSYSSHISPLLPSPHSDNRRDHNLTAENLRIARLANTSRLGFGSPTPENDVDVDDNISDISAVDEASEDAASDVSSLNELEKFDFERDTRTSGSRNGSALGSLPGARSGSAMNSNSPILGPGTGYERPWS
jgi:hypothetical protein